VIIVKKFHPSANSIVGSPPRASSDLVKAQGIGDTTQIFLKGNLRNRYRLKSSFGSDTSFSGKIGRRNEADIKFSQIDFKQTWLGILRSDKPPEKFHAL
jgi:hypothetical protein